MVIIGVTGSFGSGKSTVAKMLKRLSNGYLIDADKIARKLVEGKLKNRIVKEFGTNDRKGLAETVFSDKTKLDKLNSIVRPEVKGGISKLLRKYKKRIVIIDAPLLIEAKIKTDKIVVVKTKKNKIIKRLSKKYSKVEVLKRIRSQMAFNRKARYADYIVDNSKSLKDTEYQVKKVWGKISLRCLS